MLMLSHIFGQARQWLRLAAIALLGFGITLPALAQIRVTSSDKVIFPAGLKWERMREVEYRYTPKPAKNFKDKADDVTARMIWADEIEKSEAVMPQRNMFVLLAKTTARNGVPVIFSLLDMLDYERCEPSTNGKDMVDMYSKCLARVAIGKPSKPHLVEFNGFCYLNLDFPETPIEKNNTQFAFDANTATAYFRVIQYGKSVPACNRMIKIEGL